MLRDGNARVTQIELFYDLVYVFAVTQLAHLLYEHRTLDGAVQTLVLLVMVWQVWVYTTWMTNYLDPNRAGTRLALIVLMLASLAMSAALPFAFENRGVLVAVLYVAMQVGRSGYVIWALRGEALQQTFWRACAWSCVAAVPMLFGSVAPDHVREGLWALAVLIETVGAALGFATPGLGRSRTTDWTIDGGHFAERCQAFVLIALGESIVVTGVTLTGLLGSHSAFERYAAFAVAFVGSVALWWVYFDAAAEDSSQVIASSSDPGRLGRNAFHWVHPAVVGGIIVAAAADEVLLHDPSHRPDAAEAWLLLGGVALFLAGHAVFKAVVWRVASWPRIAAVVVLLALVPLAPHIPAMATGIVDVLIVIAVAIADRHVPHAGSPGVTSPRTTRR
jgi:low temperature requirement protein LtrA